MGRTLVIGWLTSWVTAALVVCGCMLTTEGLADPTGAAGAGGAGGDGGAAGPGGGSGGGGTCGDGVIQGGEECDDSNETPGDGCTTCVVDCLGQKDPVTFHCYRLINTPIAWLAAEQSCVAFGGHLAAITSQAELDFAQAVVAQSADNVWIGASDEVMENDFVWTTGEPWGFAPWAPNEPDGGNGQNCVFLSKNRAWMFNDFDCATGFAYLCEFAPAGS